MTRVRSSALQLTVEVVANGSRVCVTESTATARVEVASLMRMFPRIATITALALAMAISALAQKNGSITGTVRGASASVVIVIATNQVTSRVKRVRAGTDGHYRFMVASGAYRLSVAAPY